MKIEDWREKDRRRQTQRGAAVFLHLLAQQSGIGRQCIQ